MANKYNDINLFVNDYGYLYDTIKLNGWENDCYLHMNIKYIQQPRHIYAVEFKDNSVYVGLTCDVKNRRSAHLRMTESALRENKTVNSYSLKTGLKPHFKQFTENPLEESLASEMERFCVEEYRNKGWNVLNKMRAGGLGRKDVTKWTNVRVTVEGRKHNKRVDFKRNCRSGYNYAIKNNLMDTIFIGKK